MAGSRKNRTKKRVALEALGSHGGEEDERTKTLVAADDVGIALPDFVTAYPNPMYPNSINVKSMNHTALGEEDERAVEKPFAVPQLD